jgi:CHAT domain-containing protein
LSEIHQQTKLNPAVIWAVPQEKQLQLLLITPSNQIFLEKIRAANQNTLPKVIKQFDNEMVKTSRNNYTSYLTPAKLLYKWVIAPVEPYLKAEKIDTLLLCTGSGLRSLPFAALYDEDEEKFLIEKYNLARIAAFNLTDTSYQDRSSQRVLAMGASQFVDRPALPGVELELSIITPRLLSGTKILNHGFTVENLKTQHQQGKYDIVHLATHSEFNPGSPEDSYIQFSDREAEFGFAGLALQAGVKSALASLWAISDSATVALMSEFLIGLVLLLLVVRGSVVSSEK